MSGKNHISLYSFDGTQAISTAVARPDKYSGLVQVLKEEPFIVRGAGLSYCLATAGEGATSINTENFNRIIGFNESASTVTVEPGLTVGELLDFAISKKLYFPVLPGYPKITIGGCAGFNVHGKTQFAIGNFIDFVQDFVLYHPSMGEITCSRTENEALFYLTIGGMGLTGYISAITLRLIPLEGNAIKQVKIPVSNIVEAVEVMRKGKEGNNILYSWNNFNQSGKHFGKGFVFSETFVNQEISNGAKPYGSFTAAARSRPNPLANGLSFRAVPVAYSIMEGIKGNEKVMDIRGGSFPIDGKEIYFRFFGKPGFREYQAIIPFEAFAEYSGALDGIIRKFGIPVTLGSLKLFSGETRYLNFCATGVCITVDVPNYAKSIALFEAMDELVITYQGIANISKDSRIGAHTIERMYPKYALFKQKIHDLDPQKRIDSLLRKRLDV